MWWRSCSCIFIYVFKTGKLVPKIFHTFLKRGSNFTPSSNGLTPEMSLCTSIVNIFFLFFYTFLPPNAHSLWHEHENSHTAWRPSSVSYITFCQTSISIEDTSFNERRALPAAVLPSLAVNLLPPSGQTYSIRLCQFCKSWHSAASVWSKYVLTCALFFSLWWRALKGIVQSFL